MDADHQSLLRQWNVSRETTQRLEAYRDELVRWQRSINLIGRDTIDDVWTRHMLDSLQMLPLLQGKTQIADLGSGAGFPGLVLAIALQAQAGASVTLVESNGKKAAFLRHIAMMTGAPATVLAGRIEDVLPKLTPEVITARALAPLTQLIRWCEPLLKSGTVGLFHKGRDLHLELEDASRYWVIDHTITPSVVVPESYILKITTIRARNVGTGTDI